MFSELIIELLDCFSVLEHRLADFVGGVIDEPSLPVLLPENREVEYPRDLAVESLTRLFNTDEPATLIRAGILCVSPATVANAIAVNEAKAAFKQAIQRIRQVSQKNKTGTKEKITTLIERVQHKEGLRTPALDDAMRKAQLGRLDLTACYTQIRILPERLSSLSWTWQKSHASIVPVTAAEARVMAENLNNDDSRRFCLARLHALPDWHKLAYRKPLANQLRANIVWDEDGETMRKAVPISGVALCPSPKLPRTVWHPDPGDTPSIRLVRTDKTIEDEPFIPPLRLHRYIQ